MTPLMRAAATGQGDVVEMLLRRGADGQRFDNMNRGVPSLTYYSSVSAYNKLQRLSLPDGKTLQWKPALRKPDNVEVKL